jgi:hypothetical protein
MVVLSTAQTAGYLKTEGMPANRIGEFVAIAVCESGLNTGAVSPAGALGLWQIMPFNFAPLGLDVNYWSVAFTNARAAVLLSGHGSNCAAWDTCYADIAASGRYRYLNWPERGSCAANEMARIGASGGTGMSGPFFTPTFPGISDSLTGYLAQYSTIAGQAIPSRRRQMQWRASFARGMFRH